MPDHSKANPTKAPTDRRLQPLPITEWDPLMHEALDAFRGAPSGSSAAAAWTSTPSNAMGMFARHPRLAKGFMAFNRHLLVESTLSPRHRELLILRVAAVRECPFEWGQHARIGLNTGLSPEELARIAAGPGHARWSDIERALLAATDELLAGAKIRDETWATLRCALDQQQLLDVVFTVGAYDTVAMALQTFDIELDGDLARYLPIGSAPIVEGTAT
jgi:AhpD family alkylhydroperoxidase